MKISTNGKRNITLDFNAPRNFRIVQNGVEIPYLRTGKNSFRLSKKVEGDIEIEEVKEKAKRIKPFSLQSPQMTFISSDDVDRLNSAIEQISLVNPQDVAAINNAAEKIDSSQMYIAEKQQKLEATQTYIDQQQQRLNETALGIQALETDNSQRLDGAENAILNLAGEISNAQNMAVDGMNTALNKIEEQGILLQAEIDTKADKDELESLRKDFEEKSDQFSNAMSNYSGGYAYDTLPRDGEAGQILAKRTDRQGDYIWIDQTPVIVKSETIPTASEKYKGEVYQYVGETGDYTHGYIYECQQNGTSYSWVRIDVQPNTAVWGQITGTLSDQTDLQNALDNKQDTLVSGTNIKTVNGSSLLGSGNLTTSAQWGGITGTLSNQTDLQNALNAKANDSDVVKLTGNQTIADTKTFTSTLEVKDTKNALSENASTNTYTDVLIRDKNNVSLGIWEYRHLTGNGSGMSMVLRKRGSESSAVWSRIGIFQDTSGNFYTEAPTPGATDNSTKIATTAFVKAQGYITSSGTSTKANSITNQRNTSTALKVWSGTKAQYNAITTKDANTLYNITDDTDVSLTILEALYPVGSIYITTAASCPLATLISGSTWTLVSSGRVLQGADNNHAAGTTIEAGLPNITGSFEFDVWSDSSTGAFIDGGGDKRNGTDNDENSKGSKKRFDASRSSSIYGNSTTVQPPAYIVNIFRRTA